MADGKVVIKVEDNARQSAINFSALDKQLDKVEDGATSANKSFISLKGAIASVGIGVAVESTRRLAVGLVGIASDAEETQNKFNTAFRGISERAEETAKDIADSYNIARAESKALLADTGDILKGFGFTADSALALSDGIQRLAGDLTSYNNFAGGTAEASRILTKALLGERDALISLGTKINEEDLKNLAEQQGLVYKELTRSQKAMLTFNLIVAQNQDAIGDVAASQESYVNTSRDLDAALADLGATMGAILLPTATEFLGVVTDLVISFEKAINPLEKLNSQILKTEDSISDLQDKLANSDGGFLDSLVEGRRVETLNELRERLSGLKEEREKLLEVEKEAKALAEEEAQGRRAEAQERFRQQVELMKESVSGLNEEFSKTVEEVESVGDKAQEATEKLDTSKVGDKLKETQGDLNDIAEDGFQSLSRGLSTVLTTPFQEGENSARRFAQVALNVIQQVAQELLTKQLVGLFSGLLTGGTGEQVGPPQADGSFSKGGVFSGGNVQAFANGGVVSKPTFFPMANGGTGLMGEAGAEAIMPLKRGKGGRLGVEAGDVSPTVNVYNNTQARIETVKRPNNQIDVIVREVTGVLASERSDQAFGSALQRQQRAGVQGF